MTITSKIVTLLVTVLCISVFTFCTDSDEFSLSEDGTIQDLFRAFEPESKIQRATLDISNFTFTSEKNIELSADPDAFVLKDGTPVTGMVDLEFIELFTRADILKYGIPTVTDTDRAILESDGEFNITITQNGEEVRLREGKFMNIIVPDTSLNDSMQLFRDIEHNSWKLSGDSLLVSDELNAYVGQLSDLNWDNIDYYSEFDFDYTDVTVELPDSTYQWFNSRVFAIFHSQNTVIRLNYFITEVKMPIGEMITVVAMAADGPDEFLYDEVNLLIEENQPNIILSPQPATANEIENALERFN